MTTSNNRGWHRMSLSREGEEFLAEGIAVHLSNCNLIFKEDVLRAAHGLLKHERGEDVKVPTEGWYTGFVKRHKLKKKRCNIVEASRLTWATTENMQRWYLDNETATEDVEGALGDALDPKPPSTKRRRVQKPTESEKIQKTSKQTGGCARCRYSRTGCDRCDPARKKNRPVRKRSGTAKKR